MSRIHMVQFGVGFDMKLQNHQVPKPDMKAFASMRWRHVENLEPFMSTTTSLHPEVEDSTMYPTSPFRKSKPTCRSFFFSTDLMLAFGGS